MKKLAAIFVAFIALFSTCFISCSGGSDNTALLLAAAAAASKNYVIRKTVKVGGATYSYTLVNGSVLKEAGVSYSGGTVTVSMSDGSKVSIADKMLSYWDAEGKKFTGYFKVGEVSLTSDFGDKVTATCSEETLAADAKAEVEFTEGFGEPYGSDAGKLYSFTYEKSKKTMYWWLKGGKLYKAVKNGTSYKAEKQERTDHKGVIRCNGVIRLVENKLSRTFGSGLYSIYQNGEDVLTFYATEQLVGKFQGYDTKGTFVNAGGVITVTVEGVEDPHTAIYDGDNIYMTGEILMEIPNAVVTSE